MTELLDMNDDCVDHVLKWLKNSDPQSMDTMVAISLTCTRLQSLTHRFMKHTSYDCAITSDEDENRAKRTIGRVGKQLKELNVNVDAEYTALKPIFFKRLAEKCPKLKKLEVVSNMSPNVTFDGVRILLHLEHLVVSSYEYTEDVDRDVILQLASISELKYLRVAGAEWDYKTIIAFVHTAQKLDCLNFEIEYVQKHLQYEISSVFMDEFRYLNITDDSELIYFLEFRDLLKTIFH